MKLTLLLLTFAACTFDSSNVQQSNDGAVAPDSTQSDLDGPISTPDAQIEEVFGFQAVSEMWTVPDSNADLGFSSVSSYLDEKKSWFLADMNQDQKLDLVQTQDPASGNVWGAATENPFWAVFLAGTTGFSQAPIEWAVPTMLEPSGFYIKFGTGLQGTERWSTLDMNGDGCLDLVRILDPTTSAVWEDSGNFSWSVYLCDGSGFASSPIKWQVPSGDFDREERCNATDGCWSLQELTGDAFLDLVHSSELNNRPFDNLNNPHWRVHPGYASGFSLVPRIWNVPSSESAFGFYRTQSVNSGAFWRTLDIDGDGFVELVHSSPHPNPTVFRLLDSPIWRVFDAISTGFVEREPWSVPSTNVVGGFFSVDRHSDVGMVHQHWATIDINGDGNLDLIHAADSADSLEPVVWGGPAAGMWNVYLGNGNQFADSAVSWPVPDSETPSGFFATSADSSEENWAVIDLDGDGQLELIQTTNPAISDVWDAGSTKYWKVYRRSSSPKQ